MQHGQKHLPLAKTRGARPASERQDGRQLRLTRAQPTRVWSGLDTATNAPPRSLVVVARFRRSSRHGYRLAEPNRRTHAWLPACIASYGLPKGGVYDRSRSLIASTVIPWWIATAAMSIRLATSASRCPNCSTTSLTYG